MWVGKNTSESPASPAQTGPIRQGFPCFPETRHARKRRIRRVCKTANPAYGHLNYLGGPEYGLPKPYYQEAGGHTANPPVKTQRELLEFDGRAGFFQLLLHCFGFRLGHVRLHFLRRAFNKLLGFLEAQPGDAANFLDDVDFLFAG